VWPVITAAAAAAGATAVAGWQRRGRYRRPQDQPRLDLRWWWAAPILTAAAAIVLTVTGPRTPAIPLTELVFLVGGVTVSLVDLDVRRIPDRILLAWSAVTVVVLGVEAAAGASGLAVMVRAVASGAALGLVYLVLAVVASMGLGDVKLAALTGMVLGAHSWQAVYIGTLTAFFAAALIAAALLASRRGQRHHHLAFGPAIVVGALAAINLA
jgi:leader peptidase (prepilin peptidase)/N-methyltransferase